LASFCDPTLTTIRQPVDLMGKAAAELMLDLISGRPPDKRHLKPTVIVRDSA
jgi:DNA-binding LacI/PurR family transcriptional regulator